MGVGLAVVAGIFFTAPTWVTLPLDREALAFQEHASDALAPTIARAGGQERLLACGEPYTGEFQVPLVAWHLRVHIRRVLLEPKRPGVVFRTQSNPGVPPGPPLDGVGGEAAVTTLATGPNWRIVGACRGAG